MAVAAVVVTCEYERYVTVCAQVEFMAILVAGGQINGIADTQRGAVGGQPGRFFCEITD
jgi:hypothetical protein